MKFVANQEFELRSFWPKSDMFHGTFLGIEVHFNVMIQTMSKQFKEKKNRIYSVGAFNTHSVTRTHDFDMCI